MFLQVEVLYSEYLENYKLGIIDAHGKLLYFLITFGTNLTYLQHHKLGLHLDSFKKLVLIWRVEKLYISIISAQLEKDINLEDFKSDTKVWE